MLIGVYMQRSNAHYFDCIWFGFVDSLILHQRKHTLNSKTMIDTVCKRIQNECNAINTVNIVNMNDFTNVQTQYK